MAFVSVKGESPVFSQTYDCVSSVSPGSEEVKFMGFSAAAKTDSSALSDVEFPLFREELILPSLKEGELFNITVPVKSKQSRAKRGIELAKF